MDIFGDQLFTAGDVHLYGNSIIACIYFTVFVFIAKKIIVNAANRNPITLSVAFLFLISGLAFVCQAVFANPWKAPAFEAVWMLITLSPVWLFFYLRHKQALLLSDEKVLPSTARFDKLKHEFLSVASHELRTPLSVINGFAEILVREKLGPLNDEQKRRVRKILLQGQRLNHIIDELLDLSRIRSGKIEIQRDVFDMIPVLKACIEDHHIVCEQQKIKLKDNLPDLLPDVIGDLDRVTQVVVNLLNNAIKYTDPSGIVTISAKYDKVKGFVRIEVADTGIGIDEEDQSKIFEEFYRASAKHYKKYSGSGLGLTIVKQLIESQDGEVGVESEGLGKGSCFYFTLPTAKSHKGGASQHSKPLLQRAS